MDDDDKTLVVSLKSANRLKKLRKAEEEDTVSGVDYEQRLRRQYVFSINLLAQADQREHRKTIDQEELIG